MIDEKFGRVVDYSVPLGSQGVARNVAWQIVVTICSHDPVASGAAHREDNLTLLLPLGFVESLLWPGSIA